jgi:predicted MFS family arabinose efflux permease
MLAGLRIFLAFSLGYFVSYVFRGVNLVLTPHLAADIGLGPADLGILTSLYFLAFAACQLPLGVLLDRYGPRRVEVALLVVAAIGAVLFATAHSLAALMIGRILIGIGVSACLMAGLKAFILWFPADRLLLLNGGLFALGGMGAVATGTPVGWALAVTDWRGVFWGLAALTLAAALAILLAVPDRPVAEAPHHHGAPAGLVAILRSRAFWRIAPLTAISQGVFMAVQGLWAGPFLQAVGGATPQDVASIVAVMGLAMVAGYLVLGWLARRLERAGVSLLVTSAAGMVGFAAVQVLLLAGVGTVSPLIWAAYGFLGSTGILPYTLLVRAFPIRIAGRVSTAMTLLQFGTAFLFQIGFGAVLDLGPADAAAAHRLAWALALGLQVLAFLWWCRPAPVAALAAAE